LPWQDRRSCWRHGCLPWQGRRSHGGCMNRARILHDRPIPRVKAFGEDVRFAMTQPPSDSALVRLAVHMPTIAPPDRVGEAVVRAQPGVARADVRHCDAHNHTHRDKYTHMQHTHTHTHTHKQKQKQSTPRTARQTQRTTHTIPHDPTHTRTHAHTPHAHDRARTHTHTTKLTPHTQRSETNLS